MADNETVVRRGFDELWNQGNLNVADEINTPDLISHNAGRPDEYGVAELKRFVADARTAFPDLHFSINELIAQGDTVAARATFTGTHTGPLVGRGDIPSIPPTSKPISEMVVVLFHLKGGKIAETWAVVDNMSILQQLGVVPAAAATVGTQPEQQAPQPPM